MKKYLITYANISVCEEYLMIVKANSAKEAINKFHDYKINSLELYEDFEEAVDASLEGDYFEWMNNGSKGEYDWDSAIEAFFKSKKVFGNKKKYKGINLNKVIEESKNLVSECRSKDFYLSQYSMETKESIFRWMYEYLEALNMDKVKVIE
ncbi:hypothetical protein [Clostridium butyricum]|uniref:hypothetical protein n=1 Tax=Clostridium butyricum TaxID=1492 RepID=UPI000404DAF2|nr:hypothetical protein [Clostridium butyricum]